MLTCSQRDLFIRDGQFQEDIAIRFHFGKGHPFFAAGDRKESTREAKVRPIESTCDAKVHQKASTCETKVCQRESTHEGKVRQCYIYT